MKKQSETKALDSGNYCTANDMMNAFVSSIALTLL